MFNLVLFLHSVIRWAILALGVAAVYRGVRGQSSRRPWTANDAGIGLGFTIAFDLQAAIGIVLFSKSPITVLGMHELDLAMRDRVLRFWTVEHPVLMIAALVLAHIGLRRIRRLPESGQRHRAAALFFGLALLLALAGVPWPFLPYGRPLLWLPF